LPEHLRQTITPVVEQVRISPREQDRLRTQLIALLEEYEGNISAVARAMGKARFQIQRWLKRFNLSAESYRKPLWSPPR
jgi:transcriptional regulator of acetoin/glycerol metabolism